MASESIPAPPPPPALLNDNNTNTNTSPNAPTSSQTQTADNGVPSGGEKVWERAWSVDEMRKGATNWSLASDAGLLLYLQEFSQNMLSQTHSMEQKVDGLVHETKGISAKVHNTFNDFLMLSNTQFIENRVYDEEETKDEEEKLDETTAQEKEKTREELETEVIPKINEALQSGLAVLDSAFVTVEITPEQLSDDEDEGALPENMKPEPILELTDVYAHRKLPSFIGTAEFQKDDLVGLGQSSSEDEEETSEKEASGESEEMNSTEDEDTSGSETVSGSDSQSEASSTATASDDEKEVVVKKKARKDSSQDSDEDLFAAGGTEEKTAKTKYSDDDDEDDESDNEKSEGEQEEKKSQPQKAGAPMDFSAELAAKLGLKPRKPVDDSDQEADNEEDWEESRRHGSDAAKDDLFTGSVDTTASVTSKGTKKKRKKPKSRSGSHASHESVKTPAVAAGNVDLERSERHDEDDKDNLFTASIDTTSSVASKSTRSKHKHKKKTDRSASQLSIASSKSGHEEKKPSNKEESNLFSGSPEGDLFDEDTSSPFGKKGGMFSGGGGLFDDVMEDEVEPDNVDDRTSKSSHKQEESDEEVKAVKEKPRTASGKKLPAGAVSIFGDHGPFGPTPIATNEHHVAKSSAPEKKSSGGGLFSDEGEDIFTSSQSSSIVSNKPAQVATKMSKSVDLFGSGEDEGDDDDDSLFGEKPTKKAEAKVEPPKKKIPVGAVSIFGSGSPPPLFNTPNAESQESATSPANTTQSNTKEASGLFDDEDDETSPLNSQRSAVSSTAAPIAPAVKAKRKTNQISLFDDNDNEDEDGDDLFTSIAPSKTISSTKNKTVSKPDQSTNTKRAEVSKPNAPKRSTISLFDDDDDDDEEDNDGDIFSVKPALKSKPVEVRPPEKSTPTNSGLFSSEDDPLFSGAKPNATKKPDEVDSQPVIKASEQENDFILHEDGVEEVLFAEPKIKNTASGTEPPKLEEDKKSEELFDADSDDEDGGKSGRKILPGAVPMFGGVDIFAGQKPGKTTKAKLQGDSLFASDEDDLFASPPKPVPSVAPRAKPRKPPVEARQAAFLPAKETNVPEKSSPDTSVGKLQKTLAFNPAAMLPGAVPPRRRQEDSSEPVEGNEKHVMFNPATMLPGAKPPPRKQEAATEATFDKPATVKTLESSNRDRARVRAKRRPPTRQARQNAAKDSMDDAALFGSDLAGPTSHERLPVNRRSQPSVFSDPEDLFSSSSYKALQKHNQKPHSTQSNASKFDPLFIHNSTTSSSFEHSIDGISSESKKDNTSNTKLQSSKTDSVFGSTLKDDLFSTSTESENSFLPNSNSVENQSHSEETKKASNAVFDDEAKDGLFGLSTESESSFLQSGKVMGKYSPVTAQKNEKIDPLFDKSKGGLFGQSTESDVIPEKTKPPEATNREKSKIDPLFDSKQRNDLFNQSVGSNISQKDKPIEDVSVINSQKPKSDPLFDSKPPKDDLFSRSTESDMPQKVKPTEDVSATKNEMSTTDSLFDGKRKDDLFSQSVESTKASSQKVKMINEIDDDDEEDDLFKRNSRPLFSPPPLDFDSEFNASGDFTTESLPKHIKYGSLDDDDIFAPKSNKTIEKKLTSDDYDIFAPTSSKMNKNKTDKTTLDDDDDNIFAAKPNKKKDNENKSDKTMLDDDDDIFAPKASNKKDSENIIVDGQKEDIQEGPKGSEVKKTSDAMDDLFADNGSIFDDLPKKSKEKKKKKVATSKDVNIFDESKGTGDDASTSKTTKKTRPKKKGKNKTSIFDEDSPSIFDDPLNATSK